MTARGGIPSRLWTMLGGTLVLLTALILIPLFAIKWDRHFVALTLGSFRWLGLVLICVGTILGVWSAILLATRGEGTPAPWDPPQRLVLAGPFQVIRNPMMLGGFTILLGEAIVAESLAIFLYLCFMMGVGCWYVVTIEEKELETRFHDTYLAYKKWVPRWLPRLRRSPHPR